MLKRYVFKPFMLMFAIFALGIAVPVTLTSCDDDDIEDAADDLGDAVEDAGDEIEDATDGK